MDIPVLFEMLKHLSSQKSLTGLVDAMNNVVAANFSGCKIVVYELQRCRIESSSLSNILCIDCLGIGQTLQLEDEAAMLAVFLSKNKSTWNTDDGYFQIISPVITESLTISHIIKVDHPYEVPLMVQILDGLIHIFQDMFRNIQEKDYDSLTRVLNRRAFDSVIERLVHPNVLDRCIKLDRRAFKSLAIFDVDHFKKVNDNFGHAIGDEILLLFAQTVRSALREEDLFFRYGGEEFVVLLKEVDAEQTELILNRCCNIVAEKRFPQVKNISVSIGSAVLSLDEHPIKSLSKADQALYYAKSTGRNQVASYDALLEKGLIEPLEPQNTSTEFWVES